jgi:hypothetical protein
MAIWDQARRLQENPAHGEKKAVPLFTKGENLKSESGKTVWSKDGLNYYYMAEKIGKRSTMTRTSFWIFVINGNSGSLKTRVGRIPSGRTGGRMRWRKIILGRKIRWMNDGRQKIWGTLRRLMMSPSFIGMMKSETGSVVMIRMRK